MLTLSRRCRRRVTLTAEIRSWGTPDGRYAIEEINSLFGLGRRYIAVETTPEGSQGILSRHRKRGAAVKSLDRYVRSVS